MLLRAVSSFAFYISSQMLVVSMMIEAYSHDHIHEEWTPGIGVSKVIVVVIFVYGREKL